MPREFFIGSRRIADDEPCYVIAEVGHNHGGNVKTACEMIKSAAACGASAAKLQKRENWTLYSEALRSQPYLNENSFGATYGQHRDALEFGMKEYVSCRAIAQGFGIDFFATAFDEPSLAFLLELGVPCIKLASGSVTDLPLLSMAGSCGVPLILSTGGATSAEIDAAVQRLSARTDKFALLHCTASYPVRDFAELNLRCIETLRRYYPDTVIGWSGHDSGIAMSAVAYTLGARIIEKHFTLNRASKGTDHAFSLEPSGLRKIVRDLDRAHAALGDGNKRVYDSERGPIAKMRRTEQDGIWQIRSAHETHAHH